MTRPEIKKREGDEITAALVGILRNLAADKPLVECAGCERTVPADEPCKFCGEALRLLSVRRARVQRAIGEVAA